MTEVHIDPFTLGGQMLYDPENDRTDIIGAILIALGTKKELLAGSYGPVDLLVEILIHQSKPGTKDVDIARINLMLKPNSDFELKDEFRILMEQYDEADAKGFLTDPESLIDLAKLAELCGLVIVWAHKTKQENAA